MSAPTSSHGLSRDFSAAFNTPGYSPFKAAQAHATQPSDDSAVAKKQRTAAKNLAHRSQITFDQAMTIVLATNQDHAAIKRKATRVNKHDSICAPLGETAQAREIRREMGRV